MPRVRDRLRGDHTGMSGGTVEVRLYASLQKLKPTPVQTCRLDGISTVRDLAGAQGIPEREIAIVMVNGKRAHLESSLAAGNTVSLFPAIGGG
jgi:molybdopterin converting factor small subunit